MLVGLASNERLFGLSAPISVGIWLKRRLHFQQRASNSSQPEFPHSLLAYLVPSSASARWECSRSALIRWLDETDYH